MNTSELIIRCKAHLSRIEEMAARGMKDDAVLMEVARHEAAARLLRWEAEAEYEAEQKAAEWRLRMIRDAAAGVRA